MDAPSHRDPLRYPDSSFGPAGGAPFLRRLRELTSQRERYHAKVKRYLERQGGTFDDLAISAPGAVFILGMVEQRRRTSMRVLDMGLGFSTVFVTDWMGQQRDGWTMDYVGIDHDQAWLEFIAREVVDPAPSRHLMRVHPRVHYHRREPRDHSEPDWKKTGFDVIIVDHGDGAPTGLDTRAVDTPWLSEMLRPGGVMLFDDWRPKHEGRIRRALPKRWRIGAAEWTRRFPQDKAIGWAMRARAA